MRQRRSAAGGTAAPAKSLGALPSAAEIGAAFDARLSYDVAAAAVRHGLTTPEVLPPAKGFAVVFVRRANARRMLDIGPSAVVWWAAHLKGAALAVPPAGALVRIRPPADVSAERVEQLRTIFIEAGAAAVKILPPAAGAALAPQAVEAAPARGIREVVEACAARTRSKDRAALDAVLDGALSAEGL